VPSRRPGLRLTGPSTRSAAYASGPSDRDLRHPGVQRLSRDTYIPRALSAELTARAAAVLLNAPGQAVVSHVTAAELWELAIPGKGPDPRVHLTVETGSAVRNRADRFVHRLPVASDEITRIAGIPVTTATRTWRDLAMELPCPQLLAVTDQLLAGPATAATLEAALRRRPGGRGAARARAVLRVADALAGSPMESVLRWTLLDAGLPRPVLQHVVSDAAGRFAGRADLAWPALRVLVEFDGDLHRDRDVFVNDLRRQNRLVATGWTVLRFSSADLLGRPDEVVAEVRAALRQC
jgi:very-short-patch-repair endonuclease